MDVTIAGYAHVRDTAGFLAAASRVVNAANESWYRARWGVVDWHHVRGKLRQLEPPLTSPYKPKTLMQLSEELRTCSEEARGRGLYVAKAYFDGAAYAAAKLAKAQVPQAKGLEARVG